MSWRGPQGSATARDAACIRLRPLPRALRAFVRLACMHDAYVLDEARSGVDRETFEAARRLLHAGQASLRERPTVLGLRDTVSLGQVLKLWEHCDHGRLVYPEGQPWRLRVLRGAYYSVVGWYPRQTVPWALVGEAVGAAAACGKADPAFARKAAQCVPFRQVPEAHLVRQGRRTWARLGFRATHTVEALVERVWQAAALARLPVLGRAGLGAWLAKRGGFWLARGSRAACFVYRPTGPTVEDVLDGNVAFGADASWLVLGEPDTQRAVCLTRAEVQAMGW